MQLDEESERQHYRSVDKTPGDDAGAAATSKPYDAVAVMRSNDALLEGIRFHARRQRWFTAALTANMFLLCWLVYTFFWRWFYPTCQVHDLHFPGLNLHYLGYTDIFAVLAVLAFVAIVFFYYKGGRSDDDR